MSRRAVRVRRKDVLGHDGLLLVAAAGVAGTGLGLVFAVTSVVRRSKPLHPVGDVAQAVLKVAPSPINCGSPLVDEPGEHDCLVRASYAVGSGPKRADIEGFALRILPADARRGVTDILFAGTGVGPVGRYLLAVRRPGEHGPQTTLLPVRAAGRPLQLRLEPVDPRSQPWPTLYQLWWAYGRGRWHPFGALTVAWGGAGDAAERFDPVAHPLPGTSQYPAVAWLREPSYRLARLARPSAGRLPKRQPAPASKPSR